MFTAEAAEGPTLRLEELRGAKWDCKQRPSCVFVSHRGLFH